MTLGSACGNLFCMAKRDDILDYIDQRLDVKSFKDYGPQGLQIAGCEEVNKIVAGVSCSMRLFQEAADREADMIITHHGLFWDHDSRVLDEQLSAQVTSLLEDDITLTSYHLALDAHMGLGNNFKLAECIDPSGYAQRFADLGVGLETRHSMHLPAIEYKLNKVARMPVLHSFTDDCPLGISRIAIVTGRGGRYFKQAIEEGYDLFITGEGEEWAQAMSREYRVAFFACGHYNSERLGVEALTRELAEEFALDWNFVDVPNTV